MNVYSLPFINFLRLNLETQFTILVLLYFPIRQKKSCNWSNWRFVWSGFLNFSAGASPLHGVVTDLFLLTYLLFLSVLGSRNLATGSWLPLKKARLLGVVLINLFYRLRHKKGSASAPFLGLSLPATTKCGLMALNSFYRFWLRLPVEV